MGRLALERGDPEIDRLRLALAERPSTKSSLSETERNALRPCDEARRFWSQRAWSEYAAIPGMAQVTLAAVRENRSITELEAIARIGSDEARHTSLSRDLADAFGGYVADVPPDFEPASLAGPSTMELSFWTISAGCVSETISLELMRTRLRYTTDPLVRECLRHIMKDEALHARLAWTMAERLFPSQSDLDREFLADYANRTLELASRTFVTQNMEPSDRDSLRRIRSRVAELGLGAAPPDEEDLVFDRVKHEIIAPRLEKLGVRIARDDD